MTDDLADSAQGDQEAPEAGAELDVGGQEQGDYESRINRLMSLVGSRTGERDAALREAEELRTQLLATTTVDDEPQVSQQDLMFPPPPEPAADEDSAATEGGPPVIYIDSNQPPRRPSASDLPNPSDPRYQRAADEKQIAGWRRDLNAVNRQWADEARAQGLLD